MLASKSGTTIEPNSLAAYFRRRLEEDGVAPQGVDRRRLDAAVAVGRQVVGAQGVDRDQENGNELILRKEPAAPYPENEEAP